MRVKFLGQQSATYPDLHTPDGKVLSVEPGDVVELDFLPNGKWVETEDLPTGLADLPQSPPAPLDPFTAPPASENLTEPPQG